jgi:hypothetical protein
MRRMKRKHIAADMIRNFMCEGILSESNFQKLISSVKSYRYSVIECQAIVRGYTNVRSARLFILSLYWDKMMPQWWASRKKDSKKKEKKSIMIQIRE